MTTNQSSKQSSKSAKQTLDAEFQHRDKLEAAFEAEYPEGFDRLIDEIEAMKRAGLYCGQCGHGNGCEHGVPQSRV